MPPDSTTIDGPCYRPYRWAAADFQLGLRRIQPESWILIGTEHAETMRQKRARLDELGGAPRITAAANAYSSSGRLVASVGHDVAWAHEPVPRLTSQLGGRINQVLASVHADFPCERFNWQVTPLATVFFPHDDPHAANAAAMHVVVETLRRDPARVGETLWMRVERQTLSRLPDSNAVAFSLHTYSDPLSSLQLDGESARAILALLRDYSEERWKYSEMDIVREPLMSWLEAAAAPVPA